MRRPRALATAGLTVDEVGAFDLYACFPASIEVARDSFGIAVDDHRPLTLTGGLQYHGGPGSNYVTHSVANTLDWLRAGHGEVAVVHGNGYFLTKQSVGVYTTRPPATAPTPPTGLQERIDAAATTVPVDASFTGPGTILAYTVPYDRGGASPRAGSWSSTSATPPPGPATPWPGPTPPPRAFLVADDAVGAAVTAVANTRGQPGRPGLSQASRVRSGFEGQGLLGAVLHPARASPSRPAGTSSTSRTQWP